VCVGFAAVFDFSGGCVWGGGGRDCPARAFGADPPGATPLGVAGTWLLGRSWHGTKTHGPESASGHRPSWDKTEDNDGSPPLTQSKPASWPPPREGAAG